MGFQGSARSARCDRAAILAFCLAAAAQAEEPNGSRPDVPPPPLHLETAPVEVELTGSAPPAADHVEPEVTIIRRDDALLEEYRVNGLLYAVKVTPSAGPAYYLLDRDGDGRMDARMSSFGDDIVIPQWVILSW